MFLLKKLTLVLAAFALIASLADAQQWNRRISDVRIVHPPGTPPGTWRVQADVGIGGVDAPPGQLSFDCALYVNGTVISVVTLPVEPNLAPTVCPGGCSGGCSIAVSFGVPIAGSCSAVGGCHCEKNLVIDLGDINNPASTACVVQVTPHPGSLPEIDTSDDSMSRTIGENDPGTVTCAGDGTNPVPCPCANNGASGHGCSNSANTNGAELGASGFVEALAGGTDSVVLHVTGMPTGAPHLYFQGTSGGTVIPFGDGILCTTGSIIRLRVQISGSDSSHFPALSDPSLSATGGVAPGSGVTMHYQAYYRDSATYCTSATFNTTNGISLTWY